MSKEENSINNSDPNFLNKGIGISELEELPRFRDYKIFQVTTTHRDELIQNVGTWKKFHKQGVKHRDQVIIRPNSSFVFKELEGPGKITNMWFTAMPLAKENKKKPLIDSKISFSLIKSMLPVLLKLNKYKKLPDLLTKFYLRIYFDDSEKPAVDAPLGIFFGSGFGLYQHHVSRYCGMTAGGYFSQFRMPFKKNARIEIVNTTSDRVCTGFYGAITYVKYNNSDPIQNMGYFHTFYHKEAPTTIGSPYLILEQENGKGHFIGFVLNAENIKKKHGFAYLEGNTKFYINGETTPSLEFTGTEDIFQGAWYYIRSNRGQAQFDAPYHGLVYKSFNKRPQWFTFLFSKFSHCRTSQYRFFPETIPFNNKIKITIHHGEFDEIPTNYESIAYYYFENP